MQETLQFQKSHGQARATETFAFSTGTILINYQTYHVQLSLSIESNREEKRSNDTASHGVVRVNDGTVLAVSLGQCTVEARPEQPQKQCTWSR